MTLITPRMYMNGFPKAGLHLACRMAYGMFTKPDNQKHWLGTNAWTVERHNLESVGTRLKGLMPGQFLKGHMGHLKTIEAVMILAGIGCVMVYRDLRDVAVSQMYHVLTRSDKKLNHEGKAMYRDIKRKKGKEGVLLAILEGIENFPGLFDRWEVFAPWLESEWALCVSFEQMRNDPYKSANQFFDYAFWVANKISETDLEIKPSTRFAFIQRIVFEMSFRKTSTFRKGISGGWKKEFTPAVVERFKELDNDWLVRLGYEKNNTWQTI